MSIVFEVLTCGQLVLKQPMFYTFMFSHSVYVYSNQRRMYHIHIHYNESTRKDTIYLSEVRGTVHPLLISASPHCFLLRDGKDKNIRTATDPMFIAVYKYSNEPLIIKFT